MLYPCPIQLGVTRNIQAIMRCFTSDVPVFLQNEYLSMADQLSEYVVKLLDKIRGHDELEILLNKTGADSSDESYKMLARLKMAIRYNEKKVAFASMRARAHTHTRAQPRTHNRITAHTYPHAHTHTHTHTHTQYVNK